MKQIVMVLAATAVWAPAAHAIDIDGRWGLGVGAGGIIGSSPELSIFHGHSKKTGWLLDFRVTGLDRAETGRETYPDTTLITRDTSTNNNAFSAFAGPRVRRFTRPDADFSPYVDLYVQGGFSRNHYWDVRGFRGNNSSYGFSGGLALGAEYFTRWHFSVAAHSTLASVNWSHFRNNSEFTFGTQKSSGHYTTAEFSMSPSLFLRTYF